MLDSASRRPKDKWLKAVETPVTGYFHVPEATMLKTVTSLHNKKHRRIAIAFVSVLAMFVTGVLVLGVIEKARDAYDRVH
jgi:hypothetical protein